VNAAFIFQATVYTLALYSHNYLFKAADISGMGINNLYLPAISLGIPRYTFLKISSKKSGLFSAGTGPDLQKNIFLIMGVPRKQMLF